MDRLTLFTREPSEEILTLERLKAMLDEGVHIKHYIGFEISGLVHLGTGIISMQKVVDFQRAGVETTVFLADYHSWINKKLGGDLSTIRKVAGGYFKEALRQSIKALGGDPDRVNFVLGSELYDKLGVEYLTNLLKISSKVTLSRVRRSITIMGRKMGESLDFSQLLYVPMQVADIFSQKVNLAHGGMDQRKAHVIAIDVGEKEFGYKPVAVHHHLLVGLKITQQAWEKILEARRTGKRDAFEEGVLDVKMSKSKPGSAIFIHDTYEQIKAKIRGAFCPMKVAELNPVMEIARYIIFWERKEPFIVVNKKKDISRSFSTYKELEEAYVKGEVHPADLKEAVADELSRLLEPIQKYFNEGPGKALLEEMGEIRITR